MAGARRRERRRGREPQRAIATSVCVWGGAELQAPEVPTQICCRPSAEMEAQTARQKSGRSGPGSGFLDAGLACVNSARWPLLS